MNPKVDEYLKEGCGRCELYRTPECKVHSWKSELKLLRKLAIDSGLTEELKWKIPCYTLNGCNVLMISAFKEYASISFFKGALLSDPQQVLDKPGENSQAARVLRFTSVQAIKQMQELIKATIDEAIAIERSGQKIDFKARHELELPEELEKKLAELPALQAAWDALTPGRKRGYVLHFSEAKQAKTRESRIEKRIPAILEGRGLHD